MNAAIDPSPVQSLRVAGKPHIYKRTGFWRIRLPREGAMLEREYWYLSCADVRAFFTLWKL